MSIQKLPGGTRGGRTPPHVINKIVTPVMMLIHRRTGDRFNGQDLLYLTTVGAHSGKEHTHPVIRFDDGQGGWIIVASAAGAAKHPGWYHNIVAHPDQVRAEVAGRRHQVQVEQLDGEMRDRVWELITGRAPAFKQYMVKTDRPLPILRLTPRTTDAAPGS